MTPLDGYIGRPPCRLPGVVSLSCVSLSLSCVSLSLSCVYPLMKQVQFNPAYAGLFDTPTGNFKKHTKIQTLHKAWLDKVTILCLHNYIFIIYI